MFRILVFLFLAFLVWLAIRTLGGSRKRDDATTRVAPPSAPPTGRPGIEAIAQCAWCGVHVPRSEAVVVADGRVYCGVPHRDAALQVVSPVDRDRS